VLAEVGENALSKRMRLLIVRNTTYWNSVEFREFQLLDSITCSLSSSVRELLIIILRGGNSGGNSGSKAWPLPAELTTLISSAPLSSVQLSWPHLRIPANPSFLTDRSYSHNEGSKPAEITIRALPHLR